MNTRLALVCAVLALPLPAHAQLSGTGDRFLIVGENLMKGDPAASFGGHRIVTGDLNCDERDDVVVLQPGASINVGGTPVAGGGITIVPTNAVGPQATMSFEWHQGIAGVAGAVESGDSFGFSAAIADQDGDGCEDLFVGVPGENDDTTNDGLVHAFFGSATTTVSAANDETPVNFAGENDRLGTSVVAMNFSSAVVERHVVMGVPGGLTNTGIESGHILNYGSPDGSCLICTQKPFRDTPTIVTSPLAGERFGTEMLAFGDSVGQRFLALRGDGGNRLSLIRNLSGTPGFTTFTRASLTPAPNAGAADFGKVMAAGDFNGDGVESVAVLTDDGTGNASFEIFVLSRGVSNNPSFVQSQRITGPVFAGPEFLEAASMASGDFNRDGFDDLAVGFPGVDGETPTSGNVLILRGGTSGLSTIVPQRLQQGVDGLADSAATLEFFGAALATGDINGDRTDDLIVGVPGEKVGTETRGGIHLILGSAPDALFANRFE